jgi:hypothetical protein
MTASTDEFDLDIRLTEMIDTTPQIGTTSEGEGCTSGCRTCGVGTPCKTVDC